MKTYKIRDTHTVTQENIDNMLDAALYGGIAYWARDLEIVKKPDEKADYLSEYLTRGGILSIVDDEEDKKHELTLDKILKGIKIYGKYDFEDHDSGDADSIIQCALFGEVIYG